MLNDALDLLKELQAVGGNWAVAAGAVALAMRAYRAELVQAQLPAKLSWASLPEWGKKTLTFLGAAAASVVTALVSGVGLGAAAVAAIPVGLGAALMHHGTKGLGTALDSALVGNNPEYVPGTMRKATTLFLPTKLPSKK